MSVDEYVALRTFTGGEQKYYYHADTLGSIRALTNASGAAASPLISNIKCIFICLPLLSRGLAC
jgi:hypothetical protein